MNIDLNTILELFEVIIACGSLVSSVWIFTNQNRDKKIRELAKQVIAYNYLEKEAIKWISDISNDSRTRKIQIELKDKAEHNKNNIGGRPNMSENKAKGYLC